ncbi:MmgE/PrpD family protein [Ketogulonicigenium vulgare]|uniref:2-methylcitrate dehydratase 2 n=2 Tax=Ketogulonicigenium vulgare TaxID=92945 RepID=F9Y7Z7_KETVW|nr:MmgE/PrpD family protein [Ketogulonicigenium vulgare]AEM41123.1 2-methylcitrate dehydratase 2 [Ketogulonicigenium vulgare WSH-001]ALJ81262.1 2-methylcitrate dehydratase [Ketogulonicigenium vulgare]ANW34003.1 2-methylcitrate dehydratase [Ketogulonicigenium vulgare]AOZ54845.1 MmgE/PrpD [Ketogulonicigenium vulgare]
MKTYEVRVHPSAAQLPRDEQLAWHIASFAANPGALDADVLEMIACRIVDNASVALAAINRRPVASARAMALGHPRKGGATLYGLPSTQRFDAEWAAWANATAVRELDYHDTFLAAEYSHPADAISPLIAVAQQMGVTGADLARGIAVHYEVHVALVKAISLHKYKKDHAGHLAPATTAGIGAMLGLPAEVIYQAVGQAVHLAFSTRQSRKGEISSWKAYVPGFTGKLAVECIDRAMRGEGSPSPIYEGEDSVIAWMLGGKNDVYHVSLPLPGDSPRAILETYTKAHSAEYQAQALIDLAIEMGHQIPDLDQVASILLETSHHTHYVIGTGAADPQKSDPEASRETLDHSIMYILAVALEDGDWHHVDSYTRARARAADKRGLWHKITTVEHPDWTARYHEEDPDKRQFGGRIIITLKDGTVIEGARGVADAHPNGKAPWGWDAYVGKLNTLVGQELGSAGVQRFTDAAYRLASLAAAEIDLLIPALPAGTVEPSTITGEGIFDRGL